MQGGRVSDLGVWAATKGENMAKTNKLQKILDKLNALAPVQQGSRFPQFLPPTPTGRGILALRTLWTTAKYLTRPLDPQLVPAPVGSHQRRREHKQRNESHTRSRGDDHDH